jgi:phosphoribosylformylglycinamidine (FGAM) synthase-like enzyme
MLFAPAPAWGEPPPDWGANLDLIGLEGGRSDALLFGESQGRVWVAVAPDHAAPFEADAAAAGVSAACIGEVTDDGVFSIATRRGRITWPVPQLRRAWETSIEEAMKRPGLE